MDWKSIIAAITAKGMTQSQLGVALGRPQSWVSAVACGKISSIRWEDGQTLLRLHREISGPDPEKEAA